MQKYLGTTYLGNAAHSHFSLGLITRIKIATDLCIEVVPISIQLFY